MACSAPVVLCCRNGLPRRMAGTAAQATVSMRSRMRIGVSEGVCDLGKSFVRTPVAAQTNFI